MGLYKMQGFIFLGHKMYQLMKKKVEEKKLLYSFHISYYLHGNQCESCSCSRAEGIVLQNLLSEHCFWLKFLWWGWIELSVGWDIFVSCLEESRGRRRCKREDKNLLEYFILCSVIDIKCILSWSFCLKMRIKYGITRVRTEQGQRKPNSLSATTFPNTE